MESEWDLAMQAMEGRLSELDKLLTQHAPQVTPLATRTSGRAARSSGRSSRAAKDEVGML